MSKSELQILAQKRNSSKGRIKGLRNNIRGLLADPRAKNFLTAKEREQLRGAEETFDRALLSWNHNWDQIKEDLQ